MSSVLKISLLRNDYKGAEIRDSHAGKLI